MCSFWDVCLSVLFVLFVLFVSEWVCVSVRVCFYCYIIIIIIAIIEVIEVKSFVKVTVILLSLVRPGKLSMLLVYLKESTSIGM